MKQVPRSNYGFERYCIPERWASYRYQIEEILAADPSSVLEIGAGDAVTRSYIAHNTPIAYRTVDIAEDLQPDTVASVADLPFQDGAFDVAVAFQVLEHIPFEAFEQCLSELHRVARSRVIISVPHFGPAYKFWFKGRLLPEWRFAIKLPYPRKQVFDGQHYWEIGKKGYPKARVRSVIEKQFVIDKEFVPWENQYHRFFVLSKKPMVAGKARHTSLSETEGKELVHSR
jgi:ubiquinone/menaquinone biosynthesis C-methylase UbiE